MRVRALFGLAMIVGCMGAASRGEDAPVDASIAIDAGQPGIELSETMWGLFFEEINFAGDGGIYAELVRQRDFEGERPLQSWSLERDQAQGGMEIDRQAKLNDVRHQALRVTVGQVSEGGGLHVVNSGYWGIPVQKDANYSFSLYLKANDAFAGKKLQISLRDKQLATCYAQAELGPATSQWQKLSCTLTPNAEDHDGRLVITAADSGEFWLDIVSLFPPTYNNQPNGLRPDLVKLLADLKPSFFRFPGGCFAEGHTLKDAFRFKETIGPVEERTGRRCFWGYNSTDGLGYYEYLRLTEDLGADPIFCINPGGNNGATERIPLDELGPWLDTAVHAVEFAIGSSTTPWGAKRAAMGHPEPFQFKTFYLQIGNETEFGRRDYVQRFTMYRDHVKKAYPDDNVQIIADSWGLGNQQSIETYAIDFHEYMNWGRAIIDRDLYDNAPRGKPYVFKGEYATRQGADIMRALSEAVYMMGLEENGDEVKLASYAPLFGNVNDCQWNPNLIYYDNHRSMGTISYYVQQMYSQNRGDRLLPVTVSQPPAERKKEEKKMSGSIGLATWGTAVEFDSVRVVVDDQTVYENEFTDPQAIADWVSNDRGTWQVVDGVLRQSAQDDDCRLWLKGKDWSKYTMHLKARKVRGAEGFMPMFHVKNAMNFAWANFAGWSNTQHAFEVAEGGAKQLGARRAGNVKTGEWYDVEIVVDNSNVVAKLNGESLLKGDLAQVDEEPEYDVYASAVTDKAANEVLVRIVNIAETPKQLKLAVGGCTLTGQGTAITLNAENRQASQTLDDPLRYTPKSTQLDGIGTEFTHEVPPCSFTILRLRQE